jgi:hypothetical protein
MMFTCTSDTIAFISCLALTTIAQDGLGTDPSDLVTVIQIISAAFVYSWKSNMKKMFLQ